MKREAKAFVAQRFPFFVSPFGGGKDVWNEASAKGVVRKAMTTISAFTHRQLSKLSAIIACALIALALTATSVPAQTRARRATSESLPSKAGAPIQVSQADLEDVKALVAAFGTMSNEEFRAWLAGVQPEAPTAAETDESFAAITQDIRRANLPIVENGNALYHLTERARPILKFFRREQVHFIVVATSEPLIQSSPGMCVTISTGMLRLVADDDAKLCGLVAHELAHEINWRETLRAQRARNFPLSRRFELQCDAVAAYALFLNHLPPRALGQVLFGALTYSPEMAARNNGP